MVSAYWASTYFKIALTWRSIFNSRPSWKSSPGVSITENKTLSKRDSHISTQAVWISCVALGEPFKKRSTAAFWSTVAPGEVSAVSRSKRSRDVFPVPLPPTTYKQGTKMSEFVEWLADDMSQLTMRLNVGGARARRWLYLPADRGGTFVSYVVGGPVMYNDDMGPSFRFPVEGRNGLWNGMGTSG